jgi:hypothetical protein
MIEVDITNNEQGLENVNTTPPPTTENIPTEEATPQAQAPTPLTPSATITDANGNPLPYMDTFKTYMQSVKKNNGKFSIGQLYDYIKDVNFVNRKERLAMPDTDESYKKQLNSVYGSQLSDDDAQDMVSALRYISDWNNAQLNPEGEQAFIKLYEHAPSPATYVPRTNVYFNYPNSLVEKAGTAFANAGNTSAINHALYNNKTMNPDGTVVDGLPYKQNEYGVVALVPTKVVNDPEHGYIFKIIDPGFVNENDGAIVKPFLYDSKYGYMNEEAFDYNVKTGKIEQDPDNPFIGYMNDIFTGEKIAVTKNRALAGHANGASAKEYLQVFNGDLALPNKQTKTTQYTASGEAVPNINIEPLPMIVTDRHGFGSYYGRAVMQSFRRMYNMGQIWINGVDDRNTAVNYYRNVINDYYTPEGLKNTDSIFYRANAARVLGDFTVQMLPSIILSLATMGAGTGAAFGLQGAVKVAAKGAEYLAKQAVKRQIKKSIFKQIVAPKAMNVINTLSWSVPAALQSGGGMFEMGVQSGVNLEHARIMSMQMAGATLVISSALSPTFVKLGKIVTKFDTKVTQQIFNNTLKAMGRGEAATATGKTRLFMRAVNAYQRQVAKGGWGNFVLARGRDGFLAEGPEEVGELLFQWGLSLLHNKNHGGFSAYGSGRIDTNTMLSGMGQEYLIGAVLGFGGGFLHPGSLVHAAKRRQIANKDTAQTKLYGQFHARGTSSVLGESETMAADTHKKGGFGEKTLDVNGNQIVDGKGATMQAKGDFAKYFENGVMKTQNDVNFYNYLIEIYKQADIYNMAVKHIGLDKLSEETLLKMDMSGHIAVMAAKAFNALKEKQDLLIDLEGKLSAETDPAKKKDIQDQIDILKDESKNPDSIAKAQQKYDYWAKPMKEADYEIEGKPSFDYDSDKFTFEDRRANFSNYAYSEGVRDTFMLAMITKESIALNGALINGGDIYVGDEMGKKWVEMTAKTPQLIYMAIKAANQRYGDISPVGIYRDGSLYFEGVGKVINEMNNIRTNSKFTEQAKALETAFKELTDLMKSVNSDTKLDSKFANRLLEKMQKVKDLSNIDKKKLAAMLHFADVNGENGGLEKMMRDMINVNESSVQNLIGSLSNNLFDANDNVDENLNKALIAMRGIVSSLSEDYNNVFDSMSDVIDSEHYIDGFYLDIDNEDTFNDEVKHKLQLAAETMIEVMKGNITLEELANDINSMPSEFRGKNITVKEFLQWAKDQEGGETDPSTLAAMEWGVELVEDFMNRNLLYLEGLAMMQENYDDPSGHHTYLNTINKQYLNYKDEIREHYINEHDTINKIKEDLRKKGFTRDKAHNHFLFASVGNTNLYINALHNEYISYLRETFQEDDIPDPKEARSRFEKYIFTRAKEYCKEKGLKEKEFLATFREQYDTMIDAIAKYTEEYQKILDEGLRECGIDASNTYNNRNNAVITDVVDLTTLYNALFGDDMAFLEKHKSKLIDILNKLNKLQWETRAAFSGKMTLPLIMMEAFQEAHSIDYAFFDEYKGTKLTEQQAMDDTESPRRGLRGTMSPYDMELGLKYMHEVLRPDHNSEETSMLGEDATEEEKAAAKQKQEEVVSQWIEANPDFEHSTTTAMHMMITNMQIDHALGEKTITINEIYDFMNKHELDVLLDNDVFSAEEKTMLKTAVVIDKGRFDAAKTLSNLLDVVTKGDQSNANRLMLKAAHIYSKLNKSITMEQEANIIQMIANYYRSQKGDYNLGIHKGEANKFTTTPDNIICLLGAGGTGKSVVVLKTYLELLASRKEAPMKMNVMTPTVNLAHTHQEQMDDLFGQATAQGDRTAKHTDGTTIDYYTFNEIDDKSKLEGDVLIIDEASLISRGYGGLNNGGDKNAVETNKNMWKVIGARIEEAVKANPGMQIIILYDNNQTINEEVGGNSLVPFLGERTPPLQTKFRSGEINIEKLSDFFSSEGFQEFKGNATKPLPTLSTNGAPMMLEWSMGRDGNAEGVLVRKTKEDVIYDYQNDTRADKCIIVMTEEEAVNLHKMYNIPLERIGVLQYRNNKFSAQHNISGLNAANVYIAINPEEYMASKRYSPFYYAALGKMLNTAITRRSGDGLLSFVYPNGEMNMREVKSISRYNDRLSFFEGDSVEGISNVFAQNTALAIGMKNANLDRRAMVSPLKSTENKTREEKAQETPTPPPPSTTAETVETKTEEKPEDTAGEEVAEEATPTEENPPAKEKKKKKSRRQQNKERNEAEIAARERQKQLLEEEAIASEPGVPLTEEEKADIDPSIRGAKWKEPNQKLLDKFKTDMNMEIRSDRSILDASQYIKMQTDPEYYALNVENINKHHWNNVLRAAIRYYYKMYAEGTISDGILNANREFDEFLDNFRKYYNSRHTKAENIDEFNESSKKSLHNMILRLFQSSGVENYIEGTTVIAPTLFKTDKDAEIDIKDESLMITLVGEDSNGNPIVDVYSMLLFNESKEKLTEYDIQKAYITVEALRAKGYKINNMHFLKFQTSEMTSVGRETTTSHSTLNYQGDITMSLEEMLLESSEKENLINNSYNAIATLEDMANSARTVPLSTSEMGRFSTSDGNSYYVKAKITQNGNISYICSDGVVRKANELGSFSNRIKAFNSLAPEKEGVVFANSRSIPAGVHFTKNGADGSPFSNEWFLIKEAIHKEMKSNNVNRVVVTYKESELRTVPMENGRKMSFNQFTYSDVVSYHLTEEAYNQLSPELKARLIALGNKSIGFLSRSIINPISGKKLGYDELLEMGILEIGQQERLSLGYDNTLYQVRYAEIAEDVTALIRNPKDPGNPERQERIRTKLYDYFLADWVMKGNSTITDQYIHDNVLYQMNLIEERAKANRVRTALYDYSAVDYYRMSRADIAKSQEYGGYIPVKPWAESNKGQEAFDKLFGKGHVVKQENLNVESNERGMYVTYEYDGLVIPFNVAKADHGYLTDLESELDGFVAQVKEMLGYDYISPDIIRNFRDMFEASEVYSFLNANINKINENLVFSKDIKDMSEDEVKNSTFVKSRMSSYLALLDMARVEVKKAKSDTEFSYNKGLYQVSGNKDNSKRIVTIKYENLTTKADRLTGPSYLIEKGVEIVDGSNESQQSQEDVGEDGNDKVDLFKMSDDVPSGEAFLGGRSVQAAQIEIGRLIGEETASKVVRYSPDELASLGVIYMDENGMPCVP